MNSAPDHPHVVVATDLASAARSHLEFAVRLGNAIGARTTLFHAALPVLHFEDTTGYGLAVPIADLRADARGALQKLAHELDPERPPHIAVESTSDAVDAITRAAERLNADLLVLPTHGRTGLKRALLGSTAEQVVRRADCPVLLLTDAMVTQRTSPTLGRGPILLAIDPATDAAKASRVGLDLARRLGLPLRLFSAIPERQPPAHGGGTPNVQRPTDAPARLGERLKHLRRVAAELATASGVDVDVLATIGDDTAALIAETARQVNAAFLVLTTHGRRGTARLLHGSVAERVARAATTPTLCVRLPAD